MLAISCTPVVKVNVSVPPAPVTFIQLPAIATGAPQAPENTWITGSKVPLPTAVIR